jgi:PAS domain S-box-containing protein
VTSGSDSTTPIAAALQEISNVGVFRSDAEGNCLYVNDHWCKIAGLSREQALGRGWVQVLAPGDRERIPVAWTDLGAGGSFRGIYQYVRPDGREMFIQSDSMPEFDEDGRLTGVISTILDITARKRAEDEAQRNHERIQAQLDELELVYASAPVGLCVVDRDLRFLRVNRIMAAFNGRSVDDHIGHSMEEVLPDAARSQAVAIARRVLETGEFVQEEVHTVSSRDPSREHWWLVHCHAVRVDDEVTGAITVLQNITALKRVEQEFRERFEELDFLYQNTPVGLCCVDRELRFVRANEAYAEIVGRPVADVLGRSMAEIVPESARAGAEAQARAVIESGEPIFDSELRRDVPDPDQRRVWNVNVYPICSGGEVVGAMAAVQNVTRQRIAEEEATSNLEELEALYRNLPVGVCVLDRDLRYVRANTAYAETLGRSVEEVLGRSLLELLPEPIRAEAIANTRRVLETGEPLLGLEMHGYLAAEPSKHRIWRVDTHPVRVGAEVTGMMAVVQDITTLWQAERQARVRLEELESVYRNSPVGLTYVDRDLRYVRVNQVIADWNGRSIDEVVGRLYGELSPETADEAEPLLREIMERGEPVRNLQLRSRPPADPDVEHDYLMSCDPVRATDGRVMGLVCVVNDVTTLKEAEEVAAQRLRELEIVYRNAPVGLSYVDRDLRYVRVNEALARMNGRSVEEHIGRTFEQVMPGRAEALEQVTRQLLESGEPKGRLEVRTVLPSDPEAEHDLVADYELVKSRDGTAQGVITAVHDVTALRQAERDAEARLEELEGLYRNTPVALCLIDTELRYVRVNQALADLNGRPIEEHVGERVESLIPEPVRFLVDVVRRVLEGGEPVRNLVIERAALGQPGEAATVHVSLDPVHSSEGRVTGVIAVIHDISEVKRAEREAQEASERAHAHLEELEAVYANTPVGLVSLDTSLRVVRINLMLAEMTGRSPEDLIGVPVEEAIPSAEIAAQIVPQLRRALETGHGSAGVEVQGSLATDPSYRYTWLTHYHPMKSRDGAVVGVVSVVQDITLLKRQQSALVEDRDHHERGQRVARTGSYDWDFSDDSVWWSDELYLIFGHEPRSFSPTFNDFFDAVHDEDQRLVRQQIETTLETDQPCWVRFRIHRPDGTERVIVAVAAAERTEPGIAVRMVGTCQDVTDLRPGGGPLGPGSNIG